MVHAQQQLCEQVGAPEIGHARRGDGADGEGGDLRAGIARVVQQAGDPNLFLGVVGQLDREGIAQGHAEVRQPHRLERHFIFVLWPAARQQRKPMDPHRLEVVDGNQFDTSAGPLPYRHTGAQRLARFCGCHAGQRLKPFGQLGVEGLGVDRGVGQQGGVAVAVELAQQQHLGGQDRPDGIDADGDRQRNDQRARPVAPQVAEGLVRPCTHYHCQSRVSSSAWKAGRGSRSPCCMAHRPDPGGRICPIAAAGQPASSQPASNASTWSG